jgi:hypothetical protein
METNKRNPNKFSKIKVTYSVGWVSRVVCIQNTPGELSGGLQGREERNAPSKSNLADARISTHVTLATAVGKHKLIEAADRCARRKVQMPACIGRPVGRAEVPVQSSIMSSPSALRADLIADHVVHMPVFLRECVTPFLCLVSEHSDVGAGSLLPGCSLYASVVVVTA